MRTRTRVNEVPYFETVTYGVRPSTVKSDCTWNTNSVIQVSNWTLPTQGHHLYSERSTFTDDTSPKFLDMSVNGVQIQVPNFKACNSTKLFQSFEAGPKILLQWKTTLPTYCAGHVHPVDKIWKIHTSGAPTDDWNRAQLDIVPFLVKKGLFPSLSSIITNLASNGPALLKEVLTETDSLLGFEDSINILNFIAELKDVRKLPELIRKWTKTTHDISDKFLGTEFGLLPFKSDIMSILNRVSNTRDYITKWNDMAANAAVANVHRNFTKDITGFDTIHELDNPDHGYAVIEGEYQTIGSLGANFGGAGAPSGQASSSSKIKYKFKVKITGSIYYVPVVIPEDLIDNIHRAVWGVDKPLEALWNALPFSFVVDWIVNVGDYISTFERAEPLLTMKLLTSGYSVSYILEVEDNVSTSFAGFGTAPAGKFTSYYEAYTRVPVSPSSILTAGKYYGPLRFSMINGEQALLGSALLHQLLH